MRLDYQPLDIIYLLHASSRHISLRPLLQESWHFLNRIVTRIRVDGALRHAPIRNKVCDWLGKKTIGMVT